MTAHPPAQETTEEAGAACRCLCGSLLARLVPGGVELKCRRCKRTHLIPLVEADSACDACTPPQRPEAPSPESRAPRARRRRRGEETRWLDPCDGSV